MRDIRPTGLQQRFNNDLLLNEGDVEIARRLFPRLLPLLDYPELKARFVLYEKEANCARTRVRRVGFLAIICATTSLIALATKQFWPDGEVSHMVGVGIEATGLIAAIVAIGGLWLGPWKTTWLKCRLLTERIRQWHFQLFVRRGAEVEGALASPQALQSFKANRELRFAAFISEYENNAGAKLRALITDHNSPEAWLQAKGNPYSTAGSALADVCDAMFHLRFKHQHNYANFKLEMTTDENIGAFLKWPEALQLKVIEGGSAFCFGSALLASALLIFGHAFSFAPAAIHALNAAAISIAVLGVAFHALQDGLALEQEIERYSSYLSRTGHLTTRFVEAENAHEKLALMEELEVATVEEMQGFLRSHSKARFVL